MTAPGPLTGTSVVEFAGIGPGPFTAGMLAELGAEVVRLQRPSGAGGLPGGLEAIGVRNRITVDVDLKSHDGLALARTIAANADVVVEGFRPGVAERLGVGPDELCAQNPRLVYARITGWGREGPLAPTAGHDINYIALSGVLGAIGSGDPAPPLNLVGDYGGGALYAVVGILAGLVARERTGTGCVVDAAMIDGSAHLLGPIRDLLNAGLWVDRRGANLLDGGAPFYGTYRTSDEGYVAVGALEEPFYDALLDGLGLDAAALPDRTDPTAWPDLRAVFAERFAEATRAEWEEVFAGSDACVTPVLGMHEVADHPHNAARRALVAGPEGPVPAPAPRMEGAWGGSPGEHGVSDTLAALGVPDDEARRLVESGAARRV